MDFLQLHHPFFQPVWRRWLLVVFCFAWAIIEFTIGSAFWGVLMAGLAGVAIWQFFFVAWPNKALGNTDEAE